MIKIKFRPDNKCMIRFKNDSEKQFFLQAMVQLRDSKGFHPHISVKDVDGCDAKSLAPMKPIIVKPPDVIEK